MDPISVVVEALVAGAAQGVGDTAKTAVSDAYGRLKAALATRVAGRGSAEVALKEHESDPATWQAPLVRELTAAGAADAEVLALADEVVRQCEPVQATAAEYVVDMSDARGVQLGDGNTQYNTFGAP